MKGRKAFFFEKKKQKTFAPARCAAGPDANGIKVFASFFKKKSSFL